MCISVDHFLHWEVPALLTLESKHVVLRLGKQKAKFAQMPFFIMLD